MATMVLFPALIGPLGFQEVALILIVGLLLFGARLPEVGRSLGRSLMEFKRGLAGVKDQIGDLDAESDRLIDDELERRRQKSDAAYAEDAGYPSDDIDPHHDFEEDPEHGRAEDPKPGEDDHHADGTIPRDESVDLDPYADRQEPHDVGDEEKK